VLPQFGPANAQATQRLQMLENCCLKLARSAAPPIASSLSDVRLGQALPSVSVFGSTTHAVLEKNPTDRDQQQGGKPYRGDPEVGCTICGEYRRVSPRGPNRDGHS